MKNIISLLMTFALTGVAQADVTAVLVSRDALGHPGNGSSTGASVSADGRLVAFVSDADNLVPGDTNTELDVFVKNMDTGGIVRVNENVGEMRGEGFRNSGEISADGRFIVFTSGVDDRASAGGGVSADVFVKNLETGVIVRVNEEVDGAPLGEDGHNPSISANGRFVAFEVSEITSGFGGDVFVKDIETGELVRINEDAERVRLDEFSSLPRISADGRIVVFENFDVRTIPTLTLYAKNVATGEIVVVNQDVAGEQSINPEVGHGISGDGRLVVLSTTARLVSGDTDDRRDGYVKNLETGEVIRINEAADGSAGNGDIDSPYISSDGRFVVFRSAASNLVFDDTDDLADVFVKILATGEVVRIDIENANGAEEINGLTASATGRFLSFDSSLAGLVPDDGNVRSDVFLLDTDETGPTPPGNLRVVVRSATEAEVLWDRSSDLGGIAGYEATRNGEFVGLLDTPRIVEHDLQPGVRYTYSVTAVDDDGNRSATATVDFTTDGSAPSMPGNLRFQVYSDTAAELFWTRSTDDGRVRGYEIRINGEVATVRDGSSYFTEALTEGVSYDFTVTAIDDEGHRSRPASVFLVGGNQGPGGAGDDSPPKPANLRSATYSPTAIELFWDRVPGVTLSYEVSIDREVVATTRGVSYFTDALARGQRYAFGVVAIDAAGNRSETVGTEAVTEGGPSTDPPIRPEAPSDVRILVYSRTAAELFWTRAPAEDDVVRTEVRRDGEVVGMAEGNSFFDDTRRSDARHTYGLTAIDKRGNRSVTTELVETPTTTVIHRDNYIDLIGTALAAFSGENFVGALNDITDRILSSFLPEVFPENLVFPTTHACSNGGTAFFEDPLNILFTDCQIGDAVVDGDFTYFPSNAPEVGSNGLSISTNPDTTLQFDGIVTVPGNPFYRTFDVSARLTSPAESLSLSGVDTQFSFTHLLRCCVGGRDFIAEFDGSFKFASTGSDGQSISVAAVTPFWYSEPEDTHADNWNYRTGIVRLSAEDGSEVILNADTGDDTTVALRLTSDTGIDEFIQPWSLWQGVLRRAP